MLIRFIENSNKLAGDSNRDFQNFTYYCVNLMELICWSVRLDKGNFTKNPVHGFSQNGSLGTAVHRSYIWRKI